MKENIMWIVGKYRSGEDNQLSSVWDINGVFDSEEKAIAVCDNRPDYFIGPLTLNESLPDKTTSWFGLYYPAHGKQ